MKLYVDDVLVEDDFNIELVIGSSKQKLNDEYLVLTRNSIDYKWIEDIRKNSTEANGVSVIDKRNRFYLILYLVFSLKRRVHFADYLLLYSFSDDLTILPAAEDIQEFLWKKIKSFMKDNLYSWKLIKDTGFACKVRGQIPFSYYSKSEWLTLTGAKALAVYVSHTFQRRIARFMSQLWKKIAYRRIYCNLKKNYDHVEALKIRSGSGNLFFKASDGSHSVFVKAGNRFFTDIESEVNAIKYLTNNTINHELYVIPKIAASSNYTLISEYDPKQVTLEDAIEQGMVGLKEIALLIDSCIEMAKDMKAIGFVHRDIQPANFIVKMDKDNNISGFRLMDFGCAVIGAKKTGRNIRQKIIDRYAGNKYRISCDQYNDAASMFYMILQLKGFSWNLFKIGMTELFKEIEYIF